MKNIEAILAEAGVELTDEQKKAISDGVKENYKPVADWQKQKDKVDELQKSLDDTQEALKAFEGVNAEDLKKQIQELNETIEKNSKEYEAKIADRDFNDTIDKAIAGLKGKNAKAIKALLDIEALKNSKNQQDDITKALEALTTAEDSKMLFGEPEPTPEGKGDPIGTVQRQQTPKEETLNGALTAHYTKS